MSKTYTAGDCFAAVHQDARVRASLALDKRACLLAGQWARAATLYDVALREGRTTRRLGRYLDKIATQLIAHAVDVGAMVRAWIGEG